MSKSRQILAVAVFLRYPARWQLFIDSCVAKTSFSIGRSDVWPNGRVGPGRKGQDPLLRTGTRLKTQLNPPAEEPKFPEPPSAYPAGTPRFKSSSIYRLPAFFLHPNCEYFNMGKVFDAAEGTISNNTTCSVLKRLTRVQWPSTTAPRVAG